MAPNGRLARLHAHLSRSSDDATMALAAASAEAQADPLEMTPTEKFMFDLQGYLVIENFLSQDVVAALNDADNPPMVCEDSDYYGGYGGWWLVAGGW